MCFSWFQKKPHYHFKIVIKFVKYRLEKNKKKRHTMGWLVNSKPKYFKVSPVGQPCAMMVNRPHNTLYNLEKFSYLTAMHTLHVCS